MFVYKSAFIKLEACICNYSNSCAVLFTYISDLYFLHIKFVTRLYKTAAELPDQARNSVA